MYRDLVKKCGGQRTQGLLIYARVFFFFAWFYGIHAVVHGSLGMNGSVEFAPSEINLNRVLYSLPSYEAYH